MLCRVVYGVTVRYNDSSMRGLGSSQIMNGGRLCRSVVSVRMLCGSRRRCFHAHRCLQPCALFSSVCSSGVREGEGIIEAGKRRE